MVHNTIAVKERREAWKRRVGGGVRHAQRNPPHAGRPARSASARGRDLASRRHAFAKNGRRGDARLVATVHGA